MKTKTTIVDRKTIQRLLAAGCPIPHDNSDEDNPEPDLKFEVTQPDLTRAYDRRGGVGYVFVVRVTNRSYNRIQIQRFNARLPWPHQLSWPGVPYGVNPEGHVYRFESGRQFPSSNVLNHRVRERGNLEPGAIWEGLLLVSGMFHPIPSGFLHGESHDARLSACDQYGRWHRSFIEILIDRTATMPAPAIRQPGKGLFESVVNRSGFCVYVPGPLGVRGDQRAGDIEPYPTSREGEAPSESILVSSSVPVPSLPSRSTGRG